MPSEAFSKPVEDSIPKVDQTVAVGEDLEFQEKWWRFERIVWSSFALILVLDLLGVFGRGWAANTRVRTADGSLDIRYERIERTMTPSNMKLEFGPSAVHDGQVQLFVSTSVIRQLGALRIAPEPLRSAPGNGGTTYTFPVLGTPASVDISLAPPSPGIRHFTMQVPGSDAVRARVIVVP